MLSDYITSEKGFQSAVNIAYDLHNDEKIKSYIPTDSSLEIIEDVLLSTIDSTSQRARILIGAYGRGKSHLILVLLSILFKKDLSIFQALLDRMMLKRPALYDLILNQIESTKKLLPIVVRGSSLSLSQSFLSALQQSLNEEGLEDVMPKTHYQGALNTIETWRIHFPDTYENLIQKIDEPIEDFILSLQSFNSFTIKQFERIYPELTSGSTFNPFGGFDIVDLYEQVAIELKKHGYSGIYVVYDEFSKYLESSISTAEISDIKLLQDFAEKCDRSGNTQMHLMLISHKEISNYIDAKLPKDKVDGWRGVSGRFKRHSIHNHYSQTYELISSVIRKDELFWKRITKENGLLLSGIVKDETIYKLFDLHEEKEAYNLVSSTFPLHPVTVFLLPRISEKIAQNERTLFTFLSREEPFTLSTFLKNTESEFSMLKPDYIYDYFEPLLRKEPHTTETHHLYKLTNILLQKLDMDSLGARIIKLLSLIYIVEQFEKLPPTVDVIIMSFNDKDISVDEVTSALKELIDKECIVYLKRSNNQLKLKESSGVDLKEEIVSYIEKNKSNLNTKQILNNYNHDNYLYPTRYNDEFEINRYFEFFFMDGAEFWLIQDWDKFLENREADGFVIALLPSDDRELIKLRKELSTGKPIHNQVIFITPKKYLDRNDLFQEFEAVKCLREQTIDDKVLSDEYQMILEDLTDVVSEFVQSFTQPENKQVDFFHNGDKKTLFRKSHLSSLLSDICESVFSETPIINNETINKNYLPSTAINSRKKILTGLLAQTLEPNLGLTGFGQDVSFMRSTLIRTGILCEENGQPFLERSPEDINLRKMLHMILNFFLTSTNGNTKTFKILYEKLTDATYHIGLKRGIIPIYIAVALNLLNKNVTILSKGKEEDITPDLLNNINENPESFSIIVDTWNTEKHKYLMELERIFQLNVVDQEKRFNKYSYISYAMSRWYMSLPKYTKEMETVHTGLSSEKKSMSINRSWKRFRNSLRRVEINPREYLMEELFYHFEMDSFDTNILDHVERAKKFYDKALDELVVVLVHDVRNIFKVNQPEEASLNSVMLDWYESLSDKTIQHIFPQNEHRVLFLIQSTTNNQEEFVKKLGRSITGLRIDDWNDSTIPLFFEELSNLKKTVEEFDMQSHDEMISPQNSYSLVLIDSEGNEEIRSFPKTEYSNRAKLLFNEITTSLEEMGQSITKQEKRQILVEILEKLC